MCHLYQAQNYIHVVGRTMNNHDMESSEGTSLSPATSAHKGPIVFEHIRHDPLTKDGDNTHDPIYT